MTPTPLISVIIATKNRHDMLIASVAAVLRQPYPAFEIIVVDTTKTACVGMPTDPRLTYLSFPDATGNQTWQSNVGLSHSTGEIAVFCDDDVIPSEQWLTEMVAPYADPTVGGVGGRVIEGPKVEVHKTTGDEVATVAWWGQVTSDFHAQTPTPVSVSHLKGCNQSFRKSVLMQIGGFDERIDGWGMRNETDVCVRVRKAGYKLIFNPEAVLEHFGLNLWNNQDVRLGPWRNAFSGAKTQTYFVYRDLGFKAGLVWTAYYLAFTCKYLIRSAWRMTTHLAVTPVGCLVGFVESTKPQLNSGLKQETDNATGVPASAGDEPVPR